MPNTSVGNNNTDEVWSRWNGIMCDPHASGKTKFHEGYREIEIESCLFERAPKNKCNVKEPRNASKYWASKPVEVGVKGGWVLPERLNDELGKHAQVCGRTLDIYHASTDDQQTGVIKILNAADGPGWSDGR